MGCPGSDPFGLDPGSVTRGAERRITIHLPRRQRAGSRPPPPSRRDGAAATVTSARTGTSPGGPLSLSLSFTRAHTARRCALHRTRRDALTNQIGPRGVSRRAHAWEKSRRRRNATGGGAREGQPG